MPPGAQSSTQQLKALVDLGVGVHCQAHVPDTSRIFLAVGLGFHLECSLDEAPRVIQLRAAALAAKVDECVERAAQIRAHLAFVVEALAELSHARALHA